MNNICISYDNPCWKDYFLIAIISNNMLYYDYYFYVNSDNLPYYTLMADKSEERHEQKSIAYS